MDTGDKKIKKKKIGKAVYTLDDDGAFTVHKKKKVGSDGKLKVRTRVDSEGNAHYRNAKEPGYKTVKKNPGFNSKTRKTGKRKYGRLQKRS